MPRWSVIVLLIILEIFFLAGTAASGISIGILPYTCIDQFCGYSILRDTIGIFFILSAAVVLVILYNASVSSENLSRPSKLRKRKM